MYQDDFVTIHCGDCLDVMRGMDADSIDAIVSDPPYGLSFMGREWDHGVPGEPFWREALRVAKPGAHLVAFGGTRTYHRLAVAIEDAGWEIRDCLGWLYGSGFPKSLDVSKAIDKAAGAERPVVGSGKSGKTAIWSADGNMGEYAVTEPATAAAAAWSGWGTALKPAWEPIILARKPLGSTVAACVQEHGTGALNIDGCRIEYASDEDMAAAAAAAAAQRSTADQNAGRTAYGDFNNGAASLAPYLANQSKGRWPANIVHDGSDEVLAVMGDQARFFYTAKATKAERDDGLFDGDGGVGAMRDGGVGAMRDGGRNNTTPRRNYHPTVKPLDLMRWLVRLVTPPEGVVLDPFMGSGTTLKAARAEGHKSIGIDLDAGHCEIARGRLSQGVLL